MSSYLLTFWNICVLTLLKVWLLSRWIFLMTEGPTSHVNHTQKPAWCLRWYHYIKHLIIATLSVSRGPYNTLLYVYHLYYPVFHCNVDVTTREHFPDYWSIVLRFHLQPEDFRYKGSIIYCAVRLGEPLRKKQSSGLIRRIKDDMTSSL